MTHLRISEAASYLGVSDDTLRRWIEAGRLTAVVDEGGRQAVEGAEITRLMRASAPQPIGAESAHIVGR